MFTSSYKGAQIVVPERRYRELMETWYDELDSSDAKATIRRIKWRELKPPKDYFKVDVLCKHPYPEDVQRFVEAKKGEASEVIMDAAEQIFRRHGEWIAAHAMPTSAIIDGRSA